MQSIGMLSFICFATYAAKSICLPSPIVLLHFAGPAKNRGLHGISAYKVYPKPALLQASVSSYLTFSPLWHSWRHSYFLWHLLFSQKRNPAIHRCTALRCPDFPRHTYTAIAWLVTNANLNLFSHNQYNLKILAYWLITEYY